MVKGRPGLKVTGKNATATRATGTPRKLLRAALLAGLLALAVAAPAAAAPAWLPAVDLSAPGKDASNPVVAVDGAGRTAALWERQNILSHNIQVSTREPGSGFAPPVDLASNSTKPQVAMTPGGETVAAWIRFANPNSVIQIASRPPGGGFGAPVDVFTAAPNSNPQDLQLAVNTAGDVVVAWIQKDPSSGVDPGQFSVWVSVRPAGVGFSTPQIVSPSPLVLGDSSSSPRVAIDPSSDVAVVWQYSDNATPRSLVQVSTRPAGGSFSLPDAISDTSQNAATPAVAFDGANQATAVWVESDGSNQIIRAADGSPGGSFSSPDDLSASGQNAATPDIAIVPSGEAIVVWTRSDGSNFVIQASIRSPGGSFSSPDDLSASGQDASDPRVADNAAGAATVVWERSNGANDVVQASVRPAGGTFSDPVDLSAPGQNAVGPEVAMDAAGDATVVWRRSNGANEIVQAAGYDAVPPVLRNLSIPSSGMVGEPVAFSVDPFDVWPISSTAFSFGDGGVAAGSSVSHVYGAPGSFQVTVVARDSAGTPVSGAGTISIFASNDFRLGKLKRNKRTGRATLLAHVPGPGTLVLFGRGVKRATRVAARSGAVELPMKPKRRTLRTLREHGRARVRITVVFNPTGGSSARKHRLVVLIMRPRGHASSVDSTGGEAGLVAAVSRLLA